MKLVFTGFEWHANLRVEQSLVASGDLPRFIMDSYEECRGPPRLFLLDKYDFAMAQKLAASSLQFCISLFLKSMGLPYIAFLLQI